MSLSVKGHARNWIPDPEPMLPKFLFQYNPNNNSNSSNGGQIYGPNFFQNNRPDARFFQGFGEVFFLVCRWAGGDE
jgi:hypothetical protein